MITVIMRIVVDLFKTVAPEEPLKGPNARCGLCLLALNRHHHRTA